MKQYKSTGRECFYYIARKWKIIGIAALAAGILYGGYTGIKAFRNQDKDTAEIKAHNAAYEEYKSAYDNTVDSYNQTIELLEENLSEYRKDLYDSELFKMDGSKVHKAQVVLLLSKIGPDGEMVEIPSSIIAQFDKALTDRIDYEKIGKAGGVDEKTARYLFKKAQDLENGSFFISVFSENDIVANAMLDEYIRQAGELQTELEAQLGDVLLRQVNRDLYEDAREDLMTHIDGYENNIKNYQAQIDKVVAERDALQVPEGSKTPVPTNGRIIMSMIKHFIAAFAAVAACIMLLYYICFYMNGRLHSREEMSYYTGSYTVLMKKKKAGALGRFIDGKESRGTSYTADDAVMRVLSGIKASSPDSKKIMFTGSVDGKILDSLKENIEKNSKGILFGIEKNILTDNVTLDHVSHYDAVLLVEKRDKSSADMLLRQLERFDNYDKPVLGGILVE